MKKLNLTPLVAAGVAAVIQTAPNEALATPVNTVTYTNTQLFTGGTFTVPVSPAIVDADDLVSINNGSVGGNESGTFTLTVDYVGGGTQQIYSKSGNLSFAFSTIPSEPFTLGNVNGLTFNLAGSGDFMSLPIGTVFTFAVPEPATLSLFGLGAAGLWLASRRRAQK